LDAICEEEYTRNHGELNDDNDGLNPDAGVRRSSRVRRAPVLLDASPAPPKKRRRVVGKGGVDRGVESPTSLRRENRGSAGAWSSRLRSRVGNVRFRVKEEGESPRGKRKLFEGVVGKRGDADVGRKEELEGLMPKVVKSKRPGRIKATKHDEGHEDDVSHGSLEESKSQEVVLVSSSDEESDSESETEPSGEDQMDESDGNAPSVGGNEDEDQTADSDGSVPPMVENEERNLSNDLQMKECGDDIESSLQVEHEDKEDYQLEGEKEIKNVGNAAEEVDDEGLAGKEVDDGGNFLKDANVDEEVDVNENVLEDANGGRNDELKHASNDKRGHLRIKEGRRCGLCGGGTDGKPPKRLAHDNGESENEAYSGSSSSEETNYDIWDGFDDEPGWLGRLLGPINDYHGIARIWVHLHCAVWSPEVRF